MSMDDWGISTGYHDYRGNWCEVPAETLLTHQGRRVSFDVWV